MPSVSDVGVTTDGVELSAARQLDDQFVAAWNSRDVEQLLSLMAYDVMYDDAGWPAYMHGHTDVRAFLESTWRAVPDLSFTHDDTVLVDPSGTNRALLDRCRDPHWSLGSARSEPHRSTIPVPRRVVP